MDRHDIPPILIAFETWERKKARIKGLFRHLMESDLHFVEGNERTLVRRLQVALYMSEHAVHDLIREA